MIVATFAFWVASSAAMAADAKRVMLLHSFGATFKPWSEYGKSIRTELERQSPWPLDITDQSLVGARFSDDESETRFVEYLRTLFAKRPLDLIVSVGAPAAAFVQRNRQRAFAATPMVFTAVEESRVQFSNLSESDAVVAVKHDLAAIIDNIVQVLPETKTIMVINGTSPLENFWREKMQKDFRRFEGRLQFTYTNTMSFEDILKHAAQLPPHSAIFWELLIVDAAGVVHQGEKALREVREVTNAPIFSFDDSYFGTELVGGPMFSVREVAQRAADVAIRILRGETPSAIKTPAAGYAAPKYDWREMQRWGISESVLPAGSEIYFRPPAIWDQYRTQILLIIAAVGLQALLIAWLIYEHWRRQDAEVIARNTMAELTQMNRILGAGELAASIAHEINQPLTAIAANSDAVAIMLKREPPPIDEACDALDDISQNSHRAGEIIRNLRAMFRKDTEEMSPVDINRAIGVVLELMRMELLQQDIRVTTELDDRLPLVTGRDVQLQQVVLNLVMNAKEAMESTRVPRSLRVKSEIDEAGQVQVSVEDSGIGVSSSDTPRIFTSMFTTKSRGMGMGLTICRAIIEAHGGRIWMTSGKTAGSIFRFALPAT